MYPNVFGCIQMYSDVSIIPNIFRCIQMYPNVSRIPNVFIYILMNPNVFKCIRHFQIHIFCESVTERCNLDFCAKSKIIPKSP